MNTALTTPDPNGCKNCGRADCQRPQADFDSPEAWLRANVDCNKHAVNWRTLYFAARTAAEEAMHELLNVDASMKDCAEVAEKVAREIGHRWPPYDIEEEDDDE